MKIKQYQCIVCQSKTHNAHGVRIGNAFARLPYCPVHKQEADEIMSAIAVGIACQQACYREAKKRSEAQQIQPATSQDLKVFHE